MNVTTLDGKQIRWIVEISYPTTYLKYRNKMEVNIIKLRKESERERRVIKFDKLTVIIRGMS